MKFQADIQYAPLQTKIQYGDKLLLVGSCFTEHIGNHLSDTLFNVLQNPSGILFDPMAVANNLKRYINNSSITEDELFLHGEIYHSWDHHSRYSGLNATEVVENINAATYEAHTFLQQANWLIITLGSSYSYRLVNSGKAVANCHQVPASFFHKHLCTIDETVAAFDTLLHHLQFFNPSLKVIFTISPVRHLRDGVIANNRSKARLIEAVQILVERKENCFYFPAYELVVDVLRDYRFYDVDLAHPNYAATQFVITHFEQFAFSPTTLELKQSIQQIVTAAKHKSRFPQSMAHKKFLETQLHQLQRLQSAHQQISFKGLINIFQEQLQQV